MASTSEILPLYRAFLRVQRSWPEQENRAVRMKIYLLDRLRTEFREPTSEVNSRIQYGQEQLASLRRMLDNKVEEKYPLQSDTLRSFLPPAKAYALLDQESVDSLAGKTSVSYLKHYLATKLQS
ncbi:hypothetical protein DFS34DRAFT_652352 [Phlyctochytrium arcticum]|nr:hypothetical protein DFS34DRAFT_652352 [Phlyctochytrium arcticum]